MHRCIYIFVLKIIKQFTFLLEGTIAYKIVMTRKMIEGKKNISVLYKGNAIENPLNRRIPQPEQNYTFLSEQPLSSTSNFGIFAVNWLFH